MRNVVEVRKIVADIGSRGWKKAFFFCDLLIFKGNAENITFRNSNFSRGVYESVKEKQIIRVFISRLDNPNCF
jgi:hypothetical protein